MAQSFADPSDGQMESVNPGSGTAKKIGGLLVYQDKLYSSVYDFYDGGSTQLTSHFVSSPDLGVIGDVAGPQRIKFCIGDTDCLQAGFLDGYFGLVPSEWQARARRPGAQWQLLPERHRPHVVGPGGLHDRSGAARRARCRGRTARRRRRIRSSTTSPTGSAPSDGTGSFHALTEDVLRPADPVYPIDDACHNTSALFNCSSEVRGIVFPQGRAACSSSDARGSATICYGQGTSDKALHGQLVDPVNDPDVNYCFDPADHNKGFHAWPYAHYVWAYDALDFKKVRDGLRRRGI